MNFSRINNLSIKSNNLNNKYARLPFVVLGALSIYCASSFNSAVASPLVVMEVRGTNLKQGGTVESDKPLNLKEGERVTLIGANGSYVTLRGPFNDVPLKDATTSADSRQNLAALVASREARTNSVGVVRAGAETAVLPSPWLIDVARPGRRCLKIGSTPVLWREDSAKAETVAVYPGDKSWRVDLEWAAGKDRLELPPITNIDASASLVVVRAGTEINLSLSGAPADLPDPLLYASWLFHRGCAQQADAMIKELSAKNK